jgi:Flp pilus assembly protein TadG
MKRGTASSFGLLRRDESGAVFALVAIGIVAFLGLGALAIDVGKLFYIKRQLQATTDFAAAAGALSIYSTTSATTAATIYSATKSSSCANDACRNSGTGPTITMATGYPKLAALNGTSSGGCPNASQQSNFPGCTLSTATNPNANAIVVRQQTTVSLTLGELLHMGPVTLTATSLALARGPGPTPPLNVIIIVDSTESMGQPDPNGNSTTCGTANPTKIQCALFGARQLMSALVAEQDYVGIMTFPQVTTGTLADDYTCYTGRGNPPQPTTVPYNGSGGTYVVAPLNNNYQNNGGSLNGGSQLAEAAQDNCSGIQAPGGQHTYYAAAITEAQSLLAGFSSHQAGVQNIMILESDGEAGNGVGAPSTNECNLAITAAHTAAQAGTWVYAIAYGTSTAAGSCSDTETTPIANVTACQTMQNIASSPGAIPNPSLFFSDSSGGSGTCQSVNAASDLGTIFEQIAHSLTHTALIACGTTQAGGYC